MSIGAHFGHEYENDGENFLKNAFMIFHKKPLMQNING